MESKVLLKFLLPSYFINHFEIVTAYELNGILHIEFEEKKELPQEFQNCKVESKGVMPSVTIEDFPLRGKSARLHVKRRR